jgi:hypothetical protein
VRKLDDAYLSPFGDTLLPTELTHRPNTVSQQPTTAFTRTPAPLALFLAYARLHTLHTPQHLYIAQAPLSALPQALQADLPVPQLILEAGKGDIYDTSLWLGVAPTVTPLHRDPNGNLLVQIVGRKRVRLLAPRLGEEVLKDVREVVGRGCGGGRVRGDEMMVGEEREGLERVVWEEFGESCGKGEALEAEMNAGDGLFIPHGWWHAVRGVGVGLTGSVRGKMMDCKCRSELTGLQVNWWFR